jgi:HK97 family phage prohead protease
MLDRQRQVRQPEPDDDESEEDFLDGCVDEIGDAVGEDIAYEVCGNIWDESRRGKALVHKTHAGAVNGLEFVLSDETPDRMGDIIAVNGWHLENFKRNPIALFGHRSDFPIGKWSKVRVENNQLRGHLEMAPEGVSPRIDEIRRLIDAGVLRAVSVGFKALKYEPLDPDDYWGGLRYLEQELVETSLVSVPANPNALAVAKQLKISAETCNLVFAEHGRRTHERRRRRGLNGGHAETSRNAKPRNMIPIGQRITDTEARIVALRDKLTEHLGKVTDEAATDADRAVIDELNAKIADETRTRDSLRAAEQSLALTSSGERSSDNPLPGAGTGIVPYKANGGGARPFALPAKKIKPVDYMWRALTVAVLHHHHKGARSPLDLIKEQYGEDEPTRAVFDALVLRAATAPATTTTSGWAQQLVTTVFGEFIEALFPVAIYPKLAALGGSFSFGRAGIVSMPRRQQTPTIAGSFVGEGAPIPVRQGAFDSIQLTPKKMAVISTFTREISEHSTPAIEGLIRQQIIDDTAVAIDAVLLDNGAATPIRPAARVRRSSGRRARKASRAHKAIKGRRDRRAIRSSTASGRPSTIWAETATSTSTRPRITCTARRRAGIGRRPVITSSGRRRGPHRRPGRRARPTRRHRRRRA